MYVDWKPTDSEGHYHSNNEVACMSITLLRSLCATTVYLRRKINVVYNDHIENTDDDQWQQKCKHKECSIQHLSDLFAIVLAICLAIWIDLNTV